MSEMENTALIELIKTAINLSDISEHIDMDGQYREYSFYLADGQSVALEIVTITTPKKEEAFQYNIFINDTCLSSIIIPRNRKIYLAEEQQILEIFKVCATKVIYQEMSTVLSRIAGNTKFKSYNS